MYAELYIYIYVFTYVCIHTYICTYVIGVLVMSCLVFGECSTIVDIMYVCVYVCTLYVCLYAYVYTHVHICTYMHRYWQVPYFWAGLKMYDILSGKQLVKPSYFVTKTEALEEFPMLNRDRLCGAIVYYDGEWAYCEGVMGVRVSGRTVMVMGVR